MRYFILRGKVEAAKTVFLKLPVDLLDGVHKEWRKLNNDEELPGEIKDNGKEYLCYKSYFAAIEAIDNWFKFYHNSKPEEPRQQASNKFSDKVAYSYAMKNYESELQHWNQCLTKQARTTSTMIYEVLIFAENGEWMSNHNDLTIEQCEQDAQRLRDLVILRRIVIPEFTFSLFNILHTSNLFKDCFELINVIANERFKLYKEFNAQQLGHLQKNIAKLALNSKFF
jgi:nuclear pore complex protein Nup107